MEPGAACDQPGPAVSAAVRGSAALGRWRLLVGCAGSSRETRRLPAVGVGGAGRRGTGHGAGLQDWSRAWLPSKLRQSLACDYALLAGFAVPAQRTVYMLMAVAAGLLLGLTAEPLVVALALLAAVVADPMCVLAPGFWLLARRCMGSRAARPSGALVRAGRPCAAGCTERVGPGTRRAL
jgi:competence protein